MIKDRLAALQAKQSNHLQEVAIQISNEDNQKVSTDDVPEADHDRMKEFFAEVNYTREHIENLQATSDKIKKHHSALLMTTNTDEKMRQELEDLMAEVKKTTNTVRSKLKDIEKRIQQEESRNKSSADFRILKMQHSTMSRSFVQVMADHNQAQMDYRERSRGRIQRQLEITGRTLSEEELEREMEQGNSSVFTQGILMETREAKQTLADLETRHADLIKLENSIRELHDAFIDMAIIVDNQGEMIDRIEYNVANTVEYVQKANQQTKQAIKYQGKARRKKILIICCVTISLIIILTLGIGFGTNWGN